MNFMNLPVSFKTSAVLGLLLVPTAYAEVKSLSLADRLVLIRNKVSSLEEGLLETHQSQAGIQTQLKKIQQLLRLQSLEQKLGKKRLLELQHTVGELEERERSLKEKVEIQQKAIRKYLLAIESSNRGLPDNKLNPFQFLEEEKMEAPRRKVLANLVERGLKEIEILHVDLSDAAQLGSRIQEEKVQLSYLYQDLQEQEGVLELNRQLQFDLLRKKQTDHRAQFENYLKLKSAEGQVERLIKDFNARRELEKAEETEKVAQKAHALSLSQNSHLQSSVEDFSKRKGKLLFPIEGGKVVSEFGRTFDRQSGLYVFKKGIEILSQQDTPVRAVFEGKVVYSGKLPNYGQVVIIDHGDHYYSLCGHLGMVSKKVNDLVKAGDQIGQVGDLGNPLYFEIRARNIAVNPLQWLFN